MKVLNGFKLLNDKRFIYIMTDGMYWMSRVKNITPNLHLSQSDVYFSEKRCYLDIMSGTPNFLSRERIRLIVGENEPASSVSIKFGTYETIVMKGKFRVDSTYRNISNLLNTEDRAFGNIDDTKFILKIKGWTFSDTNIQSFVPDDMRVKIIHSVPKIEKRKIILTDSTVIKTKPIPDTVRKLLFED